MMLTVEEMKPCVRFASVIVRNADYDKYYHSYDYRLFYILSGTLVFSFTEKDISASVGDILIFPPNTPYKIKYKSPDGGKYIILNFDFDFSAFSQKANPPDTAEYFNKEKVFSKAFVSPFETIYHQSSAFSCEEMLMDLCAEAEKNDVYSLEASSAIMKKLIIDLLRMSGQKNDFGTQRLCKEIKRYIRENLTENITNISIAETFGYHPYYLNTVFAKCCGMTMHKYLTHIRLAKAKKLLLCTELSVAEIAELCGFQNQSFFSECFKNAFSKRPTEYRNQRI